jgi:hypothetical protein
VYLKFYSAVYCFLFEHLQLSLYYFFQVIISVLEALLSRSVADKGIQCLCFQVAIITELKGNTGMLKVIVLIKENKPDGLLKCVCGLYVCVCVRAQNTWFVMFWISSDPYKAHVLKTWYQHNV